MKLNKFVGRGIHGYLDLDFNFLDNLTFLTGINGSGKTTALNAIVALISPNLATLANLDYKNLSVDLEHQGRKLQIRSQKREDSIIFKVSSVKEDLKYPRYLSDHDFPSAALVEAESEHYREVQAAMSSHPTLRAIAALPTPMFLGLDRRARIEDDVRRPRANLRYARLSRNIFGASLSRSLIEACDLAETKYRDALIESGKLAEQFQQEILLNLITFDDSDRYKLSAPSDADRREITRTKGDLDGLAKILRLPEDEVRERMGPFLDELAELASKIPTKTNVEDALQHKQGTAMLNKLFTWSGKQPYLRRIKALSATVRKYNSLRDEILLPTTKYLELVNRFLNDSGKEIAITDKGYLSVKIQGVQHESQITSLSSGEAQIFVILTQLAFNPLAQKDNVFIIDEPELSLHLQWQELLVESMISANSNVQYVLATHSPSIILEKVASCVDISRQFSKLS
ncbi:AAA family ATPase [Candidatus Phyllobacterium onerii]|uniref:AAA family ATPase n=1 Tax=Candidatus Phyllobacterium onerii TaxID=3020828 RepID=UPI00232B5677|nr:AAA family ATPase [Phyllobacterium sp. IY22]